MRLDHITLNGLSKRIRNPKRLATKEQTGLPGDNSVMVPPDPISNSEVKRYYADDSAARPCKSRSLPGTQF